MKMFQKGHRNYEPAPALVDWRTIEMKMPWGLLLLFGGGFAIAEGSRASCLSYWIGSNLSQLRLRNSKNLT